MQYSCGHELQYIGVFSHWLGIFELSKFGAQLADWQFPARANTRADSFELALPHLISWIEVGGGGAHRGRRGRHAAAGPGRSPGRGGAIRAH